MKVFRFIALALALVATSSTALAENDFDDPIQLKGGDVPIRVEAPGYASPCWADADGDGLKDLLVGQFAGGKIHFYKNLGEGKLATRDWLKAEGEIAEVPGVW